MKGIGMIKPKSKNGQLGDRWSVTDTSPPTIDIALFAAPLYELCARDRICRQADFGQPGPCAPSGMRPGATCPRPRPSRFPACFFQLSYCLKKPFQASEMVSQLHMAYRGRLAKPSLCSSVQIISAIGVCVIVGYAVYNLPTQQSGGPGSPLPHRRPCLPLGFDRQ